MTSHTKPVAGLQRRKIGFVSRGAVAAALLLSLIMAVLPSSARADETPPMKTFDLPSGDAVSTLKQFTEQSGVQIVYLEDNVRGVTTNPVKGTISARDALTIMLTGTNLEVGEDARGGALAVRQKNPSKKSTSSDDEVIKLTPFEVSSTAYSGYAASEDMSGSKTATKLIDIPESIDVVTRDLIDDIGFQDPNDFLSESTAGVSGYAIPSPNQGVYIRGFRAQNWSVDGATEASFAQLDNFNYDAFEVVKGPSAILFGPFGAFGGYVNMMPKYAGEAGEVNQLQLTIGTSQYSSELLDVGMPLTNDGTLQGRLVAGEYDSNRAGFPGDYFHQHTLAPSFTYNISDKTKLEFRVDIESSHVRNSETAENAAGQVIPNYDNDGPEGLQPYLGTEDRSIITQTDFTSQLSDEWSLKLNFMTESEFYDTNEITLGQDVNTGLASNSSLQYPQTTYQYFNEEEIISFHSWYASGILNWNVRDLGHGLSNNASVTADMYNYLDDIIAVGTTSTAGDYPQYQVPPYTTFDPSDPNYASVANMNVELPQEIEPYAVEWLGGMDVLDTFGLFNKKLQIVAGGRYTYDSRVSDAETRSTPTAPLTGTPSTDQIAELWLKRYGIVYQPIPTLSFYFGHDEGYLTVGLVENYLGQLLPPESGKENEVGAKTELFHALGGDWSSTLAYFQLQVSNLVLGDPAHPGFDYDLPAEKNAGVDMQITYQSNKLSGTVGYYNADGPFNPYTHVRIAYAPKTTFVSWLRYNITPTIAVGGGWRYQGDSLDEFSNNTLAPYDTLSLFTEYTQKLPKGKIIWRLGMSNVTNAIAAYMEVDPERIFRQDGRETKLTATYLW